MFQAVKAVLGVVFAATALRVVSAQTICAYTSRGCIGSYGCCHNISPNVCCRYPSSSYGWSTRFTSMPANWYGYTYGDVCSTMTGGGSSSSGPVCLSVYNSPNTLAAKSSNWRYTTALPKRSTLANESESDSEIDWEGRAAAGPNCTAVDTFGFTTADDGKVHELRIPDDKTFEDLDRLAQEGGFDELLKLAGGVVV